MKLDDCPPNKRPNLHHTHGEDVTGVTHTHNVVDHYGRDIEEVTHRHDPDGNVTVGEARHKPAKQTFAT